MTKKYAVRIILLFYISLLIVPMHCFAQEPTDGYFDEFVVDKVVELNEVTHRLESLFNVARKKQSSDTAIFEKQR